MGININPKTELDLLSSLEGLLADLRILNKQMGDKRTNMSKFPDDTKKFIAELSDRIETFFKEKKY